MTKKLKRRVLSPREKKLLRSATSWVSTDLRYLDETSRDQRYTIQVISDRLADNRKLRAEIFRDLGIHSPRIKWEGRADT